MDALKDMEEGVVKGDRERVVSLVEQAIEGGSAPKDILEDGLISGMDVVGEKFKNGEMFVPEVLLSARAMHAGLDILRPLLTESGMKAKGKVVIGTVQGDLHDIGKSLVSMMLEGAGYDVIDLGADVAVDTFLSTVREKEADIVGLSALLTTTMPVMKQVIERLRDEGLSGRVKVIVGGAPVSSSFAAEIGADGFGRDATAAVAEVKRILNG